jgi:hypothetical protein
MAMELRQAIESSTGAVISTARLLSGATIMEIARHLESCLVEAPPQTVVAHGNGHPSAGRTIGQPVDTPVGLPDGWSADRVSEEVDRMSDDDIDAVLGQLLAGGETSQ